MRTLVSRLRRWLDLFWQVNGELFLTALSVAALLALILTLALTASCRTYEAVVEAPEEVWVHLELILWAFWCDILDLVDLFL